MQKKKSNFLNSFNIFDFKELGGLSLKSSKNLCSLSFLNLRE